MNRKRLPNRRPAETISFNHWNMKFHLTMGRDLDGPEIAEAFLNCGKAGEQAQIIALESAIVLSLSLQHGTPLQVIAHALPRDSEGNPLGPVGALVDIMVKS